AVAALEPSAFYAAYRDNGQGRAARDPAMMVALLLYSYAIGERSSRRTERRCVEDVATRVICANQRPDHTTIARFRQRHEAALAELFGEVLALCAEAGLVRVGVIAVDGTKVHANASERATRSYEEIAREILDAAAAVTTEDQIVIAAEVHISSADFGQLGPMVDAARAELRRARIDEPPQTVLADAGYWHQVQMERLAAEGLTVLVPPDADKRGGARPGWDGGLYSFMRRALATDHAGALYAKRKAMIEPVFADTKFNRRIDRFLRRGRAAARSEWRHTQRRSPP